jgi:hypothetical protein
MRPARTWDWPRTRRYDELSNDPDRSSPGQFYPDYIIATPGYDFQEGQGVDLDKPIITTCGSGVTAAVLAFALGVLNKEPKGLYRAPPPPMLQSPWRRKSWLRSPRAKSPKIC